MVTIDERIATLEAKLKQEKARKQLTEARKRAAESKLKRSKDTRRKILVGAAILARVERNEWPEAQLLAILDASLTRDDDRTLFGLSVSSKAEGKDIRQYLAKQALAAMCEMPPC